VSASIAPVGVGSCLIHTFLLAGEVSIWQGEVMFMFHNSKFLKLFSCSTVTGSKVNRYPLAREHILNFFYNSLQDTSFLQLPLM